MRAARDWVWLGTRAGIALWVLGIVFGMKQAYDYSNTPGPDGNITHVWPKESTLDRDPSLPTLVMAVHSECSCTDASMEELAKIMTKTRGHLAAHVLVVPAIPQTFDEARNRLWLRGLEIPGVKMHLDQDGVEAKHFGALVSGKAMLFDQQGRLEFDGGITPGRGHQGENAGERAIISWVEIGRAETRRMPVFGCLLFNDKRTL